MTLQTLSEEYRASGQACKQRVRELEGKLTDPNITETQRLLLRRRMYILTTMARDAMATAGYLQNYYRKDETV